MFELSLFVILPLDFGFVYKRVMWSCVCEEMRTGWDREQLFRKKKKILEEKST